MDNNQRCMPHLLQAPASSLETAAGRCCCRLLRTASHAACWASTCTATATGRSHCMPCTAAAGASLSRLVHRRTGAPAHKHRSGDPACCASRACMPSTACLQLSSMQEQWLASVPVTLLHCHLRHVTNRLPLHSCAPPYVQCARAHFPVAPGVFPGTPA